MDINRTAEVLSDFLVSSEKKIPRESEFTPNPDYSAENIAGMMNIQIDMRMQAFGTEDEPATIIPEQLRSDLDLMRSNYESMEEILSSVNDFAEMESLANDTNPLDTNWELRSAAAQFNEYLNANKADIERAEALLDPNQTREVPGAYDQAEREADEAEHERIISDMRGENENVTVNEAEEVSTEAVPEVDPEKLARFKEESKDRMAKICQQIGFLEKIAGKRTVDYTKDNVEKMFTYLEKQLADCKAAYMERFEESSKEKDFNFDF